MGGRKEWEGGVAVTEKAAETNSYLKFNCSEQYITAL